MGYAYIFAHTTDGRQRIGLSLIKKAYKRSDIYDIIGISGENRPPSYLTKVERQSGALSRFPDTNWFMQTTKSFVSRAVKAFEISINDHLSDAVQSTNNFNWSEQEIGERCKSYSPKACVQSRDDEEISFRVERASYKCC